MSDELVWARMQRALIFHAGRSAEGLTRWRKYQAWLAEHGYVERWEKVDTGFSKPGGRYELTALAVTAGKSWGGA